MKTLLSLAAFAMLSLGIVIRPARRAFNWALIAASFSRWPRARAMASRRSLICVVCMATICASQGRRLVSPGSPAARSNATAMCQPITIHLSPRPAAPTLIGPPGPVNPHFTHFPIDLKNDPVGSLRLRSRPQAGISGPCPRAAILGQGVGPSGLPETAYLRG